MVLVPISLMLSLRIWAQTPVPAAPAAPITRSIPNEPTPERPMVDPNALPPVSTTISIPASAEVPVAGMHKTVADEIMQTLRERQPTLSKVVEVSLNKDVLVLTGEVPNAKDRALVERMARQRAGRLKIYNRITIYQE